MCACYILYNAVLYQVFAEAGLANAFIVGEGRIVQVCLN